MAPEHRENISVASCAIALGQCIPPPIIFKGVRNEPLCYITLPDEFKILMARRGSITTDTFIKWFDHFSKFISQFYLSSMELPPT